VFQKFDYRALVGVYRYDAKTGKLDWKGRVTSKKGDFELTEVDDHGRVTGIWRGKILPNHLDGIWTNPKTKKSMPFALHAISGDLFGSLAGAPFTVETVKKSKISGSCEMDWEYDQLRGLPDQSAEKKINDTLQMLGSSASSSTCAADEDLNFESWARVTSVAAGRFLVAGSTSWVSTRTNHGGGSSACHLYDLKTGEAVSLSSYLKPAAYTLLKEWVVNGAFDGDPQVTEDFLQGKLQLWDEDICLTPNGVTFAFERDAQWNGRGTATFEVAGEEWTRYFEANEITRAIFGPR
jgi:hypothetical protein